MTQNGIKESDQNVDTTNQVEEGQNVCDAAAQQAAGLDGNRRLLESFIKSLAGNNSVSEVTKRDYAAKLNKLMKQVIFDMAAKSMVKNTR